MEAVVTMPAEPTIVINGVQLGAAQAMTIRVAVCNLLTEVSEPNALGDDEHGRAMAALYEAHAGEIIRLMHPASRRAAS